ncbi:MAG: Rne/Rng family ribonuclease [Pyrinomonadaceae bacterium]
MAKEMIVSVNGREKKIAILEDGKVTEFYIERGEENTGVVGNIYKGRVMRVLPGMQSAFVEIGLERDAFLYVSDFFDEEEEFERIVTEKSQKADVASAEKAASERLRQARLEREQAMEAAQERAEPLIDTKKTISPQRSVPVKVSDTEEVEPTPAFSAVESEKGEISETRAANVLPVAQRVEIKDLETTTPFAGDDSSFERIVDDETEGDLFKDARIQERLTDQVRAIEFEIEPTPSIEVGTFMLDASLNSSFERIADDEEAEGVSPTETSEKSGDKSSQRAVGRNRRGSKQKVEITMDAAETAKPTGVSEKAIESSDQQTVELSSRKKQRGGRRNVAKTDVPETAADKPSRGRSARQNQTESNAEQTADETAESSDQTGEAVESASKNKRGSRSVETMQNVETDTATAVQSESDDSSTSSVADAMTQGYADADASVDDLGGFREPMAVRRGGRRRRGGGNRRPDENQNNGDENSNVLDNNEETSEVETVEAVEETKPEPAPDVRRPSTGRSGNPSNRERNDRNERTELRSDKNERPERPERNERNDRNERSERNDRGGRDRRPPTITDLLREGQEILVQIAKEPIAKKGARITSHIALPGRFLVYMPTIEHAGVSRKIESSTERARLRTLIQRIRTEENLPSGGFIVRTAGVGISEQDLRDDAKYLVRTWLDIRKQSEKSKSPSLVHQDLDLVERILRDQLSDDFAAIRVDDEAEYLRVVEFINRIQPRMTSRVKLYTRDMPIMDAYNVQEEIDKAIKPRVWLRSGGYLVINQTEALVSIDVNTGKYVGGKGSNNRLEDTITKTNMEAVDEIARQVRLRDLGGIIVLDLIDMEDRRNRQKVLQTLQEALQGDKSPTKVLSFNDFGLVIMTRKRVKQSLERTLCAPCHYCQGAGLIKSPQTVAYEILTEARRLTKANLEDGIKQTTLRVHPEIAKALRSTERDVLTEIEDYLGAVDLTADIAIHQEQFDFAFV